MHYTSTLFPAGVQDLLTEASSLETASNVFAAACAETALSCQLLGRKAAENSAEARRIALARFTHLADQAQREFEPVPSLASLAPKIRPTLAPATQIPDMPSLPSASSQRSHGRSR
jgi:hypothetical protein